MGMNKITCEGYADVRESGFGKGGRSSSDFEGTDILKTGAFLAAVAAGSFVAGCIDDSAPPTKDAVKYDRDADYLMTGRVEREIENGASGFPGYEVQFLDRMLSVGQPVVLHRLDKGTVLDDSLNVCRVRNEALGPPGDYILNCGNIRHDGIEVGDFVVAYGAVEVNK